MVKNFDTSIVSVAPSYKMKQAHCHDIYELFYLDEGKCTVDVNDKFYNLESGSLIIIPAHAMHRTTYLSPTTNKRMVLYFDESELKWISDNLNHNQATEFPNEVVLQLPKKSAKTFSELITKLRYEQKGIDTISAAFVRAYFYEIMLYVMRCQRYQQNVIQKMDVTNLQIQNVIDYVIANYSSDITLQSTAKKFAMSESSLSKKFKQFTGYRFKEYLINIRIHAAEDMLINTDYTITEIAIKCGFTSSNAFGDTFKRIYNISPRDFRNMQ